MRTKVKSTATSGTGTNWTPLSSNPGTAKVSLINKSGTQIRARIVGTTDAGMPLDNSDELILYTAQNSNEIEIKRTDNSNTPATLDYKCE